MRRLFWLHLLAVILAVPVLSAGRAQAAETWHITSFRADYTVNADGSLAVTETINVDFGSLQRHGIFRELISRRPCGEIATEPDPPLFKCPAGSDRVYAIDVRSVSLNDRNIPYDVAKSGDRVKITIGDPDILVTGRQSYRIDYRVTGALNPFTRHDELYWNATGGDWPESVMDSVTVTVRLPQGTPIDVLCFEGYRSAQRCDATSSNGMATYAARRPLQPFEELTLVAAWPKGVVVIPPVPVEDNLSVDDFFTLDVIEIGGAGAVGVAGIWFVLWLWWRHGRDRRFRTLYYLTNDPSEETKPLFGRTEVVVEYLPPDDMRPAQMGLILDERADPLDVTATIIDLAVRGYVHITEIPKEGWFGKGDWELTQLREADDALQPYEALLHRELFDGKTTVKLSGLKNTFADELRRVEEELYRDAMTRKWFERRPDSARTAWLFAGFGLAIVGGGVAFVSGYFFGRLLIPLPLVLVGGLLVVLSRSMSRRTAVGSEALRRVLGFRLYVATAETRMQQFNEQQNIFARYLPYAIVFGCVEKWARAFRGLENQAADSTAAWYTGVGAFQVMAFSEGLRGFSSTVSSTISSTPGSSGGSGFSGGSSGGGGGGGGGGSW